MPTLISLAMTILTREESKTAVALIAPFALVGTGNKASSIVFIVFHVGEQLVHYTETLSCVKDCLMDAGSEPKTTSLPSSRG